MRNGTRQAHVFPAPSRASAGGLLSRARGRALGWAICALAVAAGPAQAASGDISTVAGNGVSGTGGDGGPASSAQFIAPAGVGFSGSDLYISDFDGHTVRRVDSGGGIARVAGTGTAGYSGDGGAATSAQLDQPSDVVADAAGNVYIADFLNSRIRKVTPGGTISSYAGTGVYGYSGDGGPAFAAQLGNPAGLDIDAAGNLYVADFNSTVRKITPGGFISTVAGTGVAGYSGDGGPASAAKLNQAGDVAVDGSGDVYIGEWLGQRVRRVTPGGAISTIAGTGAEGYSGNGGAATSARLSNPGGVEVGSSGNLFIAEYGNNVVRKVAGGKITPVAGTAVAGFSGDGGPALSANLDGPTRIVFSPSADLYVGDRDNRRVRKVSGLGNPDPPVFTGRSGGGATWRLKGTAPAGTTVKLYTDAGCSSTVAATGTAAEFASPGLQVQNTGFSTTFWATATDSAGNVSDCSASSHTVPGATAPAAPLIDSGPASPSNDATPTWSFSGAGASYECRLVRGATVVSDWAACSSPTTYGLGSQPDGAYTFSVRAFDGGGTPGPSASASYQLDTAAPPAPTISSSPASPGNDPTPAWSFSGEAGVALECRLERGAAVVSDWAACSSPRAFDLSSQPDGGYTFRVRAVDAAGNTGAPAGSSYELDRSAPSAPSIDSSPASPGSDSSPGWSFSGEAGASFECRLVRGATVVSDWAACSDLKAFDLSSDPDGAYSFGVRATDAAGNTGPAAASSYQFDSAAPAAPSIDSAPASPGNDTAPGWSFSGETGASFECRLERGATVVADWTSCTDSKVYDLSSRPDGSYDFKVRATDLAGNTGPAAGSSYELDTAAPAVPAIDASPTSPGSDKFPTWQFSGEAGAVLECRLERGATVVSDWATCSSPRSYDLSGEPDGAYTFSTRARDAAGNASASASSGYSLDSSVPSVPTIDSSPGPIGNDATPGWAFSGDASFECRIVRGATVVSDWASCSDPKSYDLGSEPDASYSFSVRAVNAVGARSGAASDAYELDRGAPAAPSIDSAPASPGRAASPGWAFSGEAGASFECRLARGATTVSGWAPCSSPRAFDLAGQPDGGYSFSVRARDAAGNTGAAATSDYELDTSPPGAPSIDSAPASPGSALSPSWAFSGEAGAALECRLARGAAVVSDWASCSSPHAFDLSGQPDGTYTFSARASDAAGNTGPAATSDYRLDTTAAAVQIDSGPGAVGHDRSPRWAFSAETGASFECRLVRGASTVSDWTSCASPASMDLSGEPDGGYTFSVRASDTAANQGPSASSDYVLDTVAPGAPAIDAGPRSPSRDRSPTWAFSGEDGASLECRLQGAGAPVADWHGCTSPATFDLRGQGDGRYTLAVRATDAAGNTGPSGSHGFDLDNTPPAAPAFSSEPGAAGHDPTPRWAFSGEDQATLECRLRRDGHALEDWAPCASPKGFDLTSEPDGGYALAVRATDGAGNTGAAAASHYELTRPTKGGHHDQAVPPDRALPGGRGPAFLAPAGTPAAAATPAPAATPGRGARGAPTAAGGARSPHQDGSASPDVPRHDQAGGGRADEGGSSVLDALGRAAKAVAALVDDSVFPGLLLGMVFCFFAVQNRIDRNDPKLGLAPVFADPDLEFRPLPKKR